MNFVKSNTNMTYRIISKDLINKSEPQKDFKEEKKDNVSDSTKSSLPEDKNKLSKIGNFQKEFDENKFKELEKKNQIQEPNVVEKSKSNQLVQKKMMMIKAMILKHLTYLQKKTFHLKLLSIDN